jgi:hypothetical protein
MENPLSTDPPGFTVLSTAIALTAILLLALVTRGVPGSRGKALPPGKHMSLRYRMMMIKK